MTSLTKDFPAIRACIFDMDGLLIDSEDIITMSINQLLEKYGRPALSRSIRAKLMGVPNSTNSDVFHDWAQLRIPREQFAHEATEQMKMHFPSCRPLPGAEELLSTLSRARCAATGDKIELALASGTKAHSYALKTSSPETKRLLDFFQSDRRILGDDPRLRPGRGKPAPDIYLAALQSLNSTTSCDRKVILPNECLVFEDSVAGVKAGRRAGMRVVWVPHPDLVVEYQAKQKNELFEMADRINIENDCQQNQIDDSCIDIVANLNQFDCEKYGISISC
ncbi:GS1-like protein [Histoplasma capsulatum var. duboisii H88]|uniref:GS1-like protein n=1 Tax=Ajellomyces capsulatus (strain H88) TaxID=544711 RepID=F0UAB5_AJEC8|nr:GS1-like protein [Histoplasma capsulatum var. duboisii H88]